MLKMTKRELDFKGKKAFKRTEAMLIHYIWEKYLKINVNMRKFLKLLKTKAIVPIS